MALTINYPQAQIQRAAATAQLSTGASTVVRIPMTLAGFQPAFVRIAISNGAAYVRLGTDTSTTAVTSDSIVTTNEALWLSTLGAHAVALIQAAPGGVAVASVSPCEEGALRPTSDTSGLG